MNKRVIVPIVEGFGEETAVPLLVRRWLARRRFDRHFDVPDLAINAKGCGKLKAAYDRTRHLGIEHYVEAALRSGPDAILVVLDADDECVHRSGAVGLGPKLLDRARAVAPQVPMAVVVANREYEAWFLASLSSLRGRGLLPQDRRLPEPLVPEAPKNCKGLIARLLGCHYEERVHQHRLTGGLTFSPRAARRAPSYGKLLRDLDRLAREARQRRTA